MSGYKHGGWNNNRKLYGVWTSMRSRCRNKNHKLYEHYGGRGITICKEWDDFDAFRTWALENGYVENDNRHKCTLDRIDVNGNYEPSNCRWATVQEQLNNTRRNTLIEYNGETHTLREWADIAGINYSTFCNRWVRGWSIERMITQPTKPYKRKAV